MTDPSKSIEALLADASPEADFLVVRVADAISIEYEPPAEETDAVLDRLPTSVKPMDIVPGPDAVQLARSLLTELAELQRPDLDKLDALVQKVAEESRNQQLVASTLVWGSAAILLLLVSKLKLQKNPGEGWKIDLAIGATDGRTAKIVHNVIDGAVEVAKSTVGKSKAS